MATQAHGPGRCRHTTQAMTTAGMIVHSHGPRYRNGNEQVDEDRRIEHVAELDRVRTVELAILVPAVPGLPAIEGAHVDPVVDGEGAREPVDGADQRDDPDGDRQRQQADGDRPADVCRPRGVWNAAQRMGGSMRRPTTMPSMSRYLALLDTPRVQFVLIAASVLGLIIGLDTLILHLTTDPLADVHAYYDAGARLNAGLPLYDQPAGTDDADFYRYPPLLAVAFRPLAHAAVPDRRAHLGGAPARPVRRHDLADRRPQSLDLDRPRLARRAVRVEPRGRPGTGRGHVPRRARVAVGDRLRGPPQDPARARRDLLAGPSRLARVRHVRGLGPRPARAVVRARAGGHDRVPRVPGPRAGRRRREPLAVRDLTVAVGGVRRRLRWRWPCATPRAGSAGTWRSRCRSSPTRGCSCTSCRRCWPRCGRPTPTPRQAARDVGVAAPMDEAATPSPPVSSV